MPITFFSEISGESLEGIMEIIQEKFQKEKFRKKILQENFQDKLKEELRSKEKLYKKPRKD